MNATERSRFVYVTYIRTTPEKLWEALTEPRFMREYWFDTICESEWKPGSAWRMVRGDGTLTDSGTILEAERPRQMVIRWMNEWKPELKAEGPSTCTITLEPVDDAVKLTVTHEIDRAESGLITAVSGGWPRILSNLKSLLETGAVIMTA